MDVTPTSTQPRATPDQKNDTVIDIDKGYGQTKTGASDAPTMTTLPNFDVSVPRDQQSKIKDKELDDLMAKFESFVGDRGYATEGDFQAMLGIKDEGFAQRMFKLFPKKSDRRLTVEEFETVLKFLVDASNEHKFAFLFPDF